MTVLQSVSARFTGGKTPGVAFPSNTLAGSDLLGVGVFANNNSSVMTQGLTSQNPGNQAWGSPLFSDAFAGTTGLTLNVWRIPHAPIRVTHDPSSGATFNDVFTLDAGTFSTIFLIEQDADIEDVDLFGFGHGTGTTIPAAVTTRQYGDYCLAILAHRNNDDQTLSNASSSWLPTAGAGNPVPIGAAANINSIHVGVAVLPTSTVSTYTLGSSYGTSRNYVFGIIAFKSFSGARPPYGTIGATTLWSAAASPALIGGNKQALVGVQHYYTWPALLNGDERIAPVITNLAARDPGQTSSDVSFDVNPGGLATTLQVDYTSALDGNGNPDWTLALHQAPAASPLAASNATTTVTTTLTGLTAGTTYYWRVEATNDEGTTISGYVSFATDALPTAPPVPVAINASSITPTGATLVGSVNPENLATHYYFEYGTSSSLASFTSTSDTLLGSSDDTVHTVSAVLTGLSASTTYYFRVHAYNADAPEAAGGVDSSIVSFATAAPSVGAPIPSTGAPTTTKATQLVVPGTVDPNGGATTWKAQASVNAFSSVAAETSAVALSDPTAGNVQNVSGTITGLAPNTTYVTRITATNSNSTVNASASSGIPTEPLPAISSIVASAITASSAHIAAAIGHTSMTPGAVWSLVWGTTAAYGNTAGSGTVAAGDADPTAISADITGLSASTTYHWRVQVARADGDGTLVVSSDQTFATTAAGALITVVTPAAYGPSSAISTGSTVAAPAYNIQVASDGTLHRSDTHAPITITSTTFTGSGTLIIESDTAGTRRTPAAGVLDQIIVQGPKLILRELIGTGSQGTFEVNNTAAGVDVGVEFQGSSGIWRHGRGVACSASAIKLTKSPSGLPCGNITGSWPSWVGGGQVPDMIIDNWTGQCVTASTGSALIVDAAKNVQIGGFDAGSQSTVSAVAAPLAQHAVRMDAALRSGGVKTDVQDVYITAATDATASMLSSKTGTYTFRAGTLKRCGIQVATFPNTLHQRPEKPIWFELANGTLPGSETSVNCTNAGVLAEHFVLRNALSQNLVTSTFRDGATMDQQYEVGSRVYDPADSVTLWTPAQIMDTWPNGNRYFIRPDGVRRALQARPTTPATDIAVDGLGAHVPLKNRAIIDETWTHMGGVTGDGVTEIVGVLIDPDLMQAGGTPLTTTDNSNGARVEVTTSVVVSTVTPVNITVSRPGGGTPDLSKWDTGKKLNITGATAASPIQITISKHGYLTGDVVRIAGVGGVVAANGDWTITSTGTNTFTLNGSTGAGTYTPSTGTAFRRADIFGVLSSYFDPLKPNEIAPGVPYRRQFSYFGVDTVGGRLLEVVLVDGPASAPSIRMGETPSSILSAEILKITAGVAETFHPHGYPTGESIAIVTPALTGTFTVTRVDNFRFSIDGQSAINWNPGPGTVGTATGVTLHNYGLTGQQTTFTLPAGTTLDSCWNSNFGQGISNAIIHLKAGSRVRFVRCTLNDISFACDSSASLPEMVDCDGSVIGIPGGYDYDTLSTLAVPGKYDRYTQPLPARMQIANNWFAGQDCLWYHTRTVLTGAHGDVFPGRFKTGSERNEVYVDQASPAGTNNDTESQVRPGVGQNLPKLAHFTHGDINQWFARSTSQDFKCILAGQAHSVYFGTLGSWEQHLGCTLSNSGGKYLVTLPLGQVHNFESSGFDTVLISAAGALNGIYTVTVVTNSKDTGASFVLNESTYPAPGSPATCTADHYQLMTIPGCYRSTLSTLKHVESGDRTRLSPCLAKGNATISMGLKVSPQNDGGLHPKPIVVAGLIEYRVTFRDSCIDNGGDFNLPDPQGNAWIDLGTPNRNAFTAYSGTGIPGATATVHYAV